jgi:hypothetical protein
MKKPVPHCAVMRTLIEIEPRPRVSNATRQALTVALLNLYGVSRPPFNYMTEMAR